MNKNGEYYLHTNGSLIHKNFPIDNDSPFVIRTWHDSEIGKNPNAFMIFLSQAYKLGANRCQINKLADKNNLDKYIPNWRSLVFGNDK